jgi:hypothetical protein
VIPPGAVGGAPVSEGSRSPDKGKRSETPKVSRHSKKRRFGTKSSGKKRKRAEETEMANKRLRKAGNHGDSLDKTKTTRKRNGESRKNRCQAKKERAQRKRLERRKLKKIRAFAKAKQLQRWQGAGRESKQKWLRVGTWNVLKMGAQSQVFDTEVKMRIIMEHVEDMGWKAAMLSDVGFGITGVR